MSHNDVSPIERLLGVLAGQVTRRPYLFLWPQLVLFAICIAYTVSNLEFVMDRNALLDANLEYNQNFLRYRKEFPAQADLVAVVESENPEKNRQFVERLGVRLEAESTLVSPTNLFTDIFFKGDLTLLGRKALLFVPETNLVSLQGALQDYRPFLQQFAGASNLGSLFDRVNTIIRTSPQQTNSGAESLIETLPALERIVRRAQESLTLPGTPPSPGVEALFAGGKEEAEGRKYVTFGRGRIYLVTARPRAVAPEELAPPPPTFWSALLSRGAERTPEQVEAWRKSQQEALNAQAVNRFRSLVESVQAEIGGINAGVTGEGVLDYDEMVQSQKDSTFASAFSLGLVALIFVFGYREAYRPLLAIGCLVIGLGYTMAFTTLTVGHLNILTITFVPMLIGLAIDFGVHLISRFEEELGNGQVPAEAITTAVVQTGKGIFTGCLTTAGAFAAMSITNFRGIREMGIICGGGLVICLIPMMTLLPALLLARARRSTPAPERRHPTPGPVPGGSDLRARFERLWLERPATVLGIATVLSMVTAVAATRVHFDYNLLNMQSPELPSVKFEHKLVDSAEKSVIFGAVVATNLAEAAELERRLRNHPTVGSVESMATFLAEDAGPKLELIRKIRETTEPIRFTEPDTRPVDLHDLSQSLWSLQGYLGLAADEVKARGRTNLLAEILSLKDSLGEFRAALFRGDPKQRETTARKLSAFQVALFSDLRMTIDTLRNQDDSGGLRPQDLPGPLRNRFIGTNGSLLLQVYPRTNVWDRIPQAEFVAGLHSVAPTATGAPVQMYFYTELLKQSYIEAAMWALLAVVVLAGVHFRTLSGIVLALLPVGLGGLWVVGLMGMAGVSFNPANIMMLPLVIGIGITNGVHILNRFAEERNPSILAKSTGKAVLVSGLTTVAGFGSLVMAEHQGIRSLGFIMAVGTSTCMIAGLTVLPAILTLRQRRRSEPR